MSSYLNSNLKQRYKKHKSIWKSVVDRSISEGTLCQYGLINQFWHQIGRTECKFIARRPVDVMVSFIATVCDLIVSNVIYCVERCGWRIIHRHHIRSWTSIECDFRRRSFSVHSISLRVAEHLFAPIASKYRFVPRVHRLPITAAQWVYVCFNGGPATHSDRHQI